MRDIYLYIFYELNERKMSAADVIFRALTYNTPFFDVFLLRFG